MRKKSLFYRFTLGLLLGALLMPAQPAQAQWPVFDPSQYALQVKKRVEEAQRWVEMVNHHTQIYFTLLQQLSTMKGVLGKAEELVTDRLISKETMKDVGLTVRSAFQLKDQVQRIARSRLVMLTSIDDRLKKGIFDPQADLRDFEHYLRTSIGRSSQDSLANLERLRNMDNILERLFKDLEDAEVALAAAHLDRKTWELKLADATSPRLATSERDPTAIGTIIQKLNNIDLLIAQYTKQVEDLQKQITERNKQYHNLMDARIKFGEHVKTTSRGWTALSEAMKEIEGSLGKF
jgi:hypothetical protein